MYITFSGVLRDSGSLKWVPFFIIMYTNAALNDRTIPPLFREYITYCTMFHAKLPVKVVEPPFNKIKRRNLINDKK